MESFFSADDIEGGYTTVTPKLFIGQPPFPAWAVKNPTEGAWRIRAANAVTVANSDEARAILVELGVDPDRIEQLLDAARYGLLSAYPQA